MILLCKRARYEFKGRKGGGVSGVFFRVDPKSIVPLLMN